jgi:radical SAM superfamily enzyme
MKTQYDRIGDLLKRRTGATAYEIALKCGTVCPHKRMNEMRDKGWTITRKPVVGETWGRYYGKPPCK